MESLKKRKKSRLKRNCSNPNLTFTLMELSKRHFMFLHENPLRKKMNNKLRMENPPKLTEAKESSSQGKNLKLAVQ
jgi:hypothetical protein